MTNDVYDPYGSRYSRHDILVSSNNNDSTVRPINQKDYLGERKEYVRTMG